MDVNFRKSLLLVLGAAFIMQSYLVYFDQAGRTGGPLSVDARYGKQIFQKHNCQACHQVYGFGGFLGPDLTNSTTRLPLETFKSIIKVGPGQMPSFNLTNTETHALYQYFVALNQTGLSQATAKDAALLESRDALLTFGLPWFEYK